MAREIFGPLGGIVEIGAVQATRAWALPDVSVGAFLARRQDEVGRLLATVREIGGFSDASMAIADELGWLRDHQVTAPSLLLWSGAIEEISPRLEELEEPSAVRRLCRMGADLQLAHFLQALVTAAIVGGKDVQRVAERKGSPKLSPLLCPSRTMRGEALLRARSGRGGSTSCRATSVQVRMPRRAARRASGPMPARWRNCSMRAARRNGTHSPRALPVPGAVWLPLL
ncbi:hypothetical protein [Streptomyces albicerus]|uniref:hypothetical protein n=1 Tax=Streptomyces albicerus TaxID=2569859 RepID=UPI00124B6D8B|nr:hypothetical protein [Streptomyces albicerus]